MANTAPVTTYVPKGKKKPAKKKKKQTSSLVGDYLNSGGSI